MTIDMRKVMPVLARHEGEWKGEYIHVTPDNEILDRHASHLICSFPSDGDFNYFQKNIYTWDDGKREEIDFPAVYRDGRIWWDNERIEGSSWELDERTVVLNWTRKDMPGSYLYEMIQINEANNSRGRTWHWFVDDELIKRTCIKEHRIS